MISKYSQQFKAAEAVALITSEMFREDPLETLELSNNAVPSTPMAADLLDMPYMMQRQSVHCSCAHGSLVLRDIAK